MNKIIEAALSAIGLDGLPNVIVALLVVSILKFPTCFLKWMDAWENLRHKKVMNRLAEKSRELRVETLTRPKPGEQVAGLAQVAGGGRCALDDLMEVEAIAILGAGTR